MIQKKETVSRQFLFLWTGIDSLIVFRFVLFLFVFVFARGNAKVILKGFAKRINGRIVKQLCNFRKGELAVFNQELCAFQLFVGQIFKQGDFRCLLKHLGEIGIVVVEMGCDIGEASNREDICVDISHNRIT